MSADAYTIVIPAPASWKNSNHRKHHMVDARLTKAWREAGASWARAAGLPRIEEPVHITATIHMTTARKYDPNNYWPTVKAACDGLQDAGVLIDDDSEHVIGPDMRRGEKRTPSALTLTIRLCQEDAA